MADRLPVVALLSVEPWDDVWRRNQHLAAGLVRSGAVEKLVFVTPPVGGLALRSVVTIPLPGIEVFTPPLLVPRRYGGHRVLAAWLRRHLRHVDLLWVNDPVAGAGVAGRGRPAIYDITDDWRSMPQRAADRAAVVAAEDLLARTATTVVCSPVLADRWHERYGLNPVVVPNGVDLDAMAIAQPQRLDGRAPHAVYVGTLHANRLDENLVLDLARDFAGTVHLVGPDYLDAAVRDRLTAAGVRRHGPVPSTTVASWLVAADVLICPHRVDEFTLSLDAIKAHEYLATDRPIVATPTSGFQAIDADGLFVARGAEFVAGVNAAVASGPITRPAPPSWADRVDAFAQVLTGALA